MVKKQIKRICSRFPFWGVMFFTFTLVGISFFQNIAEFHGMDVLQLFRPADRMMLEGNACGMYFFALFPIIVVLPSAYIYLRDEETGCINYEVTRSGAMNYGMGTLAAVGITSAMSFVIPLLIEIIVSYVAFGEKLAGSELGGSIYSDAYIELMKTIAFSWLFMHAEILYSLLHVLWVGLFAASLAMFTYALTLRIRLKLHVFYLVPVYVLLQFSSVIQKYLNSDFIQISYVDYLSLETMRYPGVIEGLMICFVLISSSVIITRKKFSGDCIV